eukprot:PITA_13484
MEEEYNSLLENQTWDLVPFLQEGNLSDANGSTGPRVLQMGKISRRKARLVSKGFQQVHGIDYDETFATVAKMDSIRLALAIAAAQRWEVHQMDVKHAFLHGDLSEEIYMEQPHGFIQDSSLVCRLKKSLYSLKQTPRACLVCNDLLITGSSASAIATVKRALHDRFLMTDMGPLHFFLGLEISQDATGLKLSQAKYAWDLLERFRMTDCKPVPTPFLSGIRLEDGGDTPLVNSTLYR